MGLNANFRKRNFRNHCIRSIMLPEVSDTENQIKCENKEHRTDRRRKQARQRERKIPEWNKRDRTQPGNEPKEGGKLAVQSPVYHMG